MGLVALDVSAFGVVMSADSQPVEFVDGENRVLTTTTQRTTRNPILIRVGGGFRGLTGYVGTERIGGATTRDWLSQFGQDHADDDLGSYANALAAALTEEWQLFGVASVLEILIGGVETGDVQFWYVRNSQGLREHDWTYEAPSAQFSAVPDLDANYVARDLQPGQTKDELLQTRMYSFRQGVLLPAAHVFNAFSEIIGAIYTHGIDGFEPIASLDDLAYFARQRMEFMKRLYSAKHGIYKDSPSPLGGVVHVLGVTVDGEIREYPKIRGQARTLRTA